MDIKLKTIKARKLDLNYPFEFNYWSIYNLFARSEFKKKQTIKFGLEIPLYNKNNLYKMYSKPIVINDEIYKFYLDKTYAVSAPNYITFTENAYKSSCVHSRNQQKTFCNKPNKTIACNFELFSNDKARESNCLKRLPNDNYMTQIENDFYFTIIKPLIVKIDCIEENEKKMKIMRSINIH